MLVGTLCVAIGFVERTETETVDSREGTPKTLLCARRVVRVVGYDGHMYGCTEYLSLMLVRPWVRYESNEL